MSQGQGVIEERNGKDMWIIKDFNSIPIGDPKTEQPFVFSPTFSTPTPISNTPRLNWRLKLYPSLKMEDENQVSLYLIYKGEHEITAYMSLSILSSKHEKLLKRRMKEPHTFNCKKNVWGFSKFISRKDLTKKKHPMLVDDTLRISWSINFVNSTCHQDYTDLVFSHYKKLLHCGNYSDVTFKIGEHEVRLHNAILTTFSPVFQAMFEHDMKEKKESKVDITDIKYETMQDLIRYIYLRQVDNIKQKAGDLLVAADKYAVIGLKSLCEQTLSDGLNIDNAIHHLGLAVMHNAMNLKSKVTDFMTNELEDLIGRDDFKGMDSSLKDEIFKAIVLQKQAKK